MNKISVMSLGFLKETVLPYKTDGDISALRSRYVAFLQDVQRAGYAAVDIASFEAELLGEAFLSEQFKLHGLELASLIHIDRFADANIKDECIRKACEVVDTAKRLEAKTFMLVPNPHDGIEELSAEEIHKNLAACWRPVVKYAVQSGITPIIEDYPDLSLHITTAREVSDLLEEIEGLKLVYDSANMIFGGEDSVDFLKYFTAEKIGHVHIKDVVITNEVTECGERLSDGRKVTTVFTGTGSINIPAVIAALKDKGYKGYYAVEYAQKPNATRLQSLAECREYVGKLLEG